MAVTIKLDLDTQGVRAGLKRTQANLKASSQKLNALSSALAAKALVAGAAFTGIGFAIGKIVSEAAKIEAIKTQFAVLTKSVTKANIAIEELQEFSATTPFQFEDIANAGKKLLGFGFEVESIKDHLQSLGDVSAAVGTPLGELATVFGQVKSEGKLSGERLKQFQEKAVPIASALAKTMGIAETSIRDFVSAGKIDFKTFEKAFQSISQEGGIAFEGMIKASKTTSGVISTLKDNFSLFLVFLGNNFLPEIKAVALAMITFFQKLKENKELLKTLANILKLTAAFFGIKAVVLLTGAVFAKVLALGVGVAGGAVTAFNTAVVLSSNVMKTAGLATKLFSALMSGNLTKALGIAKLGVGGLKFAVRGLIGATGIGLLITFLPEILQFFGSFWDDFVRIGKAAMDGFIELFSGFRTLFKSAVTLDLAGFKEGLGQMKNAFVNFYKNAKKVSEENKESLEVGSDIDPAKEKARLAALAAADAAATKKKNEENIIRREQEVDSATEQAAILFELGIENDAIAEEYSAEKYEEDKELRQTRENELIAIAQRGVLSQDEAERKRGAEATKILKKRSDQEKELVKLKYSAIKNITIDGLTAISTMDEKYKRIAFLASQAFAIADIAIKTAQGVAFALTTPATYSAVPFIIAQGAAQSAVVIAQTFAAPKAQTGGIVGRAMGTPPSGDHQLMFAEPGEMITPGRDVEMNRMASEIIVNSNKETEEGEDPEPLGIDINFMGQYSEILEAEQRENRALGIGVT